MQLGMIGLGRMGANMVRRLMRHGHDAVVFDMSPDAVAQLAGEGAVGGRLARGLRREARHAARGVADGPRRRRRPDARRPAAAARRRRRRDRRRQLELPRRPAPCQAGGGARGPLRRLRHERRRVGPGARLLADDRRRRRGRASGSRRSSSALAPGVEAAARTPGRDGDLAARRGGLAALRPARRRPLREDGPQRDRVRDHGRLRRGPEHPQARERRRAGSATSTPRRRRSPTPRRTGTTSTCRPSRRCGGAAA